MIRLRKSGSVSSRSSILPTLRFDVLFDRHSNFLEPSLHTLFPCSNLV
jgi:hypothetical protein